MVARCALVALWLGVAACRGERSAAESGAAGGPVRLVFRHQPLWGPPGPFRELLAAFEREHPGVHVDTEVIPNASDLAHQLYLTALEGGAASFDVFVADVIWVPELARAGWVADLSRELPPDALAREMLPGPAEVAVRDGRTVAVPWYVDVGLLYYRKDLVPRAPRTYAELERFARDAMAREPGLAGHLWQGRQYEGLTCNVYESIWGHGGEAGEGARVRVDTPAARAALGWLRHLVVSGVSPGWVLSAAEEDARRPFLAGRAVFMRNWPYAWAEIEREGSPVKGRVGVAPLPSASGEPGPGALGGWQLVVNARVPPERRAAAVALVRHLTSREAAVRLAVAYARIPARRDAYEDPRLREEAPFIAGLRPLVEAARPRPVTPYYNLVADVLQSEFSAAVAGVREPGEALGRAQRLVDRVTGGAP